jgi:hypothetical protein
MKRNEHFSIKNNWRLSILSKITYIILIISIYSTNDEKELHYRGISITWRRLVSSKSDEIRLEIIIILPLADKSFSLCDSHHPNTHEISSNFGIECIDSWDNCLSWPLKTLFLECHSKSHDDRLF